MTQIVQKRTMKKKRRWNLQCHQQLYDADLVNELVLEYQHRPIHNMLLNTLIYMKKSKYPSSFWMINYQGSAG
eukprot:scaffold2917_cov282-Chaetoceros_neogracile.AAC.1